MDAEWIKSPTGRRVLEHWADPRPAWLWSADGESLIWRNLSARLFHGRAKGRANRPAPEAIPIRGQVARLIRLGSPGRASLSRMQFLSGDRPVSATCACTPLLLPEGQLALLIVGVDPIEDELLDGSLSADQTTEGLFSRGGDYLLIDDDVQIAGGSPRALEHYAPVIESQGLPPLDVDQNGTLEIGGAVRFTRFKASPQDASLLLFEAPVPDSTAGAAELRSAVLPWPSAPAEPLLPLGLPLIDLPRPAAAAPSPEDNWGEPQREETHSPAGLSSLFDRLLDDSALFEPLRPDEDFHGPAVSTEPTDTGAGVAPPFEGEPVAEALPTEVEAVSDIVAAPETAPVPEPAITPAAPQPPPSGPSEGIEPVAPAAVAQPSAEAPQPAPTLYRITGRGFVPLASAADGSAETAPAEMVSPPADEAPTYVDMESLLAALPAEAPEVPFALAADAIEDSAAETGSDEPEAAEPAPAEGSRARPEADATPPAGNDAETVDRVSRYNFDELSRILNDRVGNTESPGEPGRVTAFNARAAAPAVPSATPEGALVTLGGETLVLNRLPLGILVFRDQQVLFANRAITEMVGYESVESLRHAGLGAIFPAAAGETQEAGPVNHLVQRDGTLVPVTARLQSVSWQGKPALMLSASATEVRTGHEAAVRAFAELLAATRADGFIEASRSGVVTAISREARAILGRTEAQLLGRSLQQLVADRDRPALREFLERPARFAETARPAITLESADAGTEMALFAQGQAGVVSGYFGLVRRKAGPQLPALAAPSDADPALLGRLSRGVRRPLNTVIGFSDLIGSAAFGPIDNARYVEYAHDIKTAGLEIAALVDELDDFARLRDGRYAARPTDIDLAGLLDSCVARIRSQASAARVLVRTAVSERLPRVRADRASLAQAVLNLLASAIDQTSAEGSVVLSAQLDDGGGITINVRDSARGIADVSERFVVFRDGIGRDGEVLTPVRSSVGLALTRALAAVNAAALSVDPITGSGTLFSLTIPPENVVLAALPGGGSSS